MADGFWTSFADRVIAAQAARAPRVSAARGAGPHGRLGEPGDDSEPGHESEPGDGGEQADNGDTPSGVRLASPLEVLDRLVTVRRHTVAVVIPGHGRPELHRPGDVLRPRLRPTRDQQRVLVLSTAPVTLDLHLDDLVVLDGSSLGPTVVRLTVQLTPDDRRVLPLAAEHPDDLEDTLLRLVHQQLADAVRGAVRTTPLGEDPCARLTELLADHWLPPTFAGGVLTWHDVVVLGSYPDSTGPGATADPGGEVFTLTLDDELAGVWRGHVDLELSGIAAAQVRDHTTVVAVTPALAAYESSRLQEAFGRHFTDPGVRLVVGPADSYADLLATWFAQVDCGPARLVAVDPDDDAVLRVLVEGVSQQAGVGNPADRLALRRLVPHQHLEFVAAEQDADRG